MFAKGDTLRVVGPTRLLDAVHLHEYHHLVGQLVTVHQGGVIRYQQRDDGPLVVLVDVAGGVDRWWIPIEALHPPVTVAWVYAEEEA